MTRLAFVALPAVILRSVFYAYASAIFAFHFYDHLDLNIVLYFVITKTLSKFTQAIE